MMMRFWILTRPLIRTTSQPIVINIQPQPSTMEVNDVHSSQLFYGGMFTTDNLNHVVQPLNVNSKIKPRSLNLTSNASVHNRVPHELSKVLGPRKYFRCSEVYLVTREEREMIRNHQLILVKGFLVKNMRFFNSIQNHRFVDYTTRIFIRIF
jgi:hypothetical protein